jgi:hypothetical protein
MTVIEGRENVEFARWLAVRSALGLEIKTGMKMSNRYNTATVARNILSAHQRPTPRPKTKVWAELNALIVEVGGTTFGKEAPTPRA